MEVSDQLHAPGRFTSGTHWKGGRMGPRAGLEAVELKKKSLDPTGNRTPAVQPVPRRYTD
jgi:hypothetical protein